MFAAWLNHDDSRGLNSLDMLERADGKAWVRHYMFDFGSIMGSGTVFAQKPRAGNEYIFDLKPGLLTALTFGLYFKPWITIRYPDVPASVGRFEGTRFKPEAWKPEYPNPAFQNMRPEDAFWGARLVARFTPEDVAAIVAKGEYSDPAATAYVTKVLLERRRKVLETWLNGVTPLVEPAIVDGVLHAVNVAVAEGVAEAPKRYTAQWFTWDNAAGTRQPVGGRGRAGGFGRSGSAVAGRARQPRGGRVHWSDRRRRAPGPPGLGRASGDLLVPPHSGRLGSGRDHSRTTPGGPSMSRVRYSNRRSRALLTAALVALPPVVPSALGADTAAPIARKKPTVRELHGEKFVDDYFWLREKGTPEVKAYLEAENVHTDAVMAPYKELQETLYKEMLGRIKETDLSVPVRDGAYFYYTRTEQGQQYPIYCRKKGSLDAPEEVYLDVNALAKGEKFMAIGTTSVSDDGNLLAYTTDTTGFREYKLYVRDLRTGELLEQPAEKVTSVDWAADNKTLFYTTTDAAKRPYRLYRHAHRRRRRRHDALRGEGRALQRRRRPVAQQGLPVPRDRQPDDVRGALPRRRPAGRDVEDRRAAQGQPRVRRRSPRRSVLRPHQPGRPQLRAGRRRR